MEEGKMWKSHKPAGSGRLGCILIVVAIFLIWGGGQGLYTALGNRELTEMTLAEYEKKKPDANWLKLKQCRINLLEACTKSSFGKISEVYLPLHPAVGEPSKPSEGSKDGPEPTNEGAKTGETPVGNVPSNEKKEGEKAASPEGKSEKETKKENKPPIHVLWATKDQTLLDLIEKMEKVSDQAGMFQFAAKHHEQIIQTREIEGLVRFGVDLKDKDHAKLAKLNTELSPDFIILADGQQPSFVVSAFLLLGGIVLLIVMIKAMAKSSKG
jgi:hypothetical protein